MSTKIDEVTLRNGAVELGVFVGATMLSFRRLFDESPLIAYDLVMLCRDSTYQPFGKAMDELKRLSLVQSNGQVHQSIKNVVLSATEGDGLDLICISPIASDAT